MRVGGEDRQFKASFDCTGRKGDGTREATREDDSQRLNKKGSVVTISNGLFCKAPSRTSMPYVRAEQEINVSTSHTTVKWKRSR